MEDNKILFELIEREAKRQRGCLELIASENFVSNDVLKAAGSILTNKYAEGYPGRRYYGGCEYVDIVENLAISRVKEIFGADYANVQPHSGSQANTAVLSACLNPGDKILGFDLTHGGHLTHGSSVNFSGKLYTPTFYGVDKESLLLDYDNIARIAEKEKPQLIIAGASAYSRNIDYKRFREIADQVGAILLADIAHPAGLIAKGLLDDPIPYCHIVTTTTHKTLRGPRGGVILMGKDFENPFGKKDSKGKLRMMSSLLDGVVFPGIQGGPFMHIIAAKAAAFGEILSEGFEEYIKQVQINARRMGREFMSRGYNIVSGGTDNHLILIDLRNKKLSGKLAQTILDNAGITVNKNMVPYDTLPTSLTSGIRLGSAAVTTRGLKESDMEIIAHFVDNVLANPDNDTLHRKIRDQVNEMMMERPMFENLN